VEAIPVRRSVPGSVHIEPTDVGATDDPGSVPELVAQLHDEIARDGPITFARFMEIALYDPAHGYYRSEAERPGRGGDFLTAPETHPIFGQAIARQIEQLWELLTRPRPFALFEYGAGSGALAEAMLRELERTDGPMTGLAVYEAAEINRYRSAALDARLAAADLGRQADAHPAVGCVVANEFLDALPVHRVQWIGGRLQELFVDKAGTSAVDGFADRPGDPSTPALAAHLAAEGVVLAEGQHAEVCLGLDGWFEDLAGRIERGYAIVIDYGRPGPELYSAGRFGGTVMGYVRHRAIEDPYRNIGRQDLTAHVDFTAVQLAAQRHGFEPLGLTTQAEFIIGAGAEELLERVRSDPRTDLAAWVELRSAVVRMLDPRAMGGFRVLMLARNAPMSPLPRGVVLQTPASPSETGATTART
jgi:SAM-dependent MidA family methyltransferase